ncbi:hypothetical protein IB231_03235 [Pantoea sp. PNT02]|jgi:hypothetical protein|uniref:hypothetical protein n=1 Tax=Pantoea TaxID=53335 RepID=UPI001784086F|nr:MULTISPECIES: hypothetical protein [Pantoea]MBD9642640.1 hypothetical protein [Pantoea sp. PNT02]WFL65987.1 hypothetical protein P6287_11415 [Pantoea sp. X85]WGK55769.1 hypothetical protein PO881_11470 [Pantoea sp. SS70]
MLILRAIIVMMVFSLTGCTYYLWSLSDTRSTTVREMNFSDRISGMFEYKNVNLTEEDNGTGKDIIRLPDEGVGFVGDDNIYFVTVNGNELLALNDLMKKVPLRMNNDDKFIDMNLKGHYSKNTNAEFQQTMSVRTRKPVTALTQSQKKALEDKRFSSVDGYLQRSVTVEGIIINRMRLGSSFPQTTSLDESYQVRFYSSYRYDKFDSGSLALKLALTPVTLIGDVVFIPLYLLTAK